MVWVKANIVTEDLKTGTLLVKGKANPEERIKKPQRACTPLGPQSHPAEVKLDHLQ